VQDKNLLAMNDERVLMGEKSVKDTEVVEDWWECVVTPEWVGTQLTLPQTNKHFMNIHQPRPTWGQCSGGRWLCGFDFRSLYCTVIWWMTLGKLSTHVPLSPSSIIWYQGSHSNGISKFQDFFSTMNNWKSWPIRLLYYRLRPCR